MKLIILFPVFPLNQKRVDEIERELAARRAAAPPGMTPLRLNNE